MYLANANRKFSHNNIANLLNLQKTVQKILIHKYDFS